MKFNRNTIILVAISLGLAGVVYFQEIKPNGLSLENQQEDQQTTEPIFPFLMDEIQEVTVNYQEQTIVFRKQVSESEVSWQMIQPQQFTVSEGSINFLLNLFPAANKTVEIEDTQAKQAEYGLLDSVKTVEVVLDNDDRYQMILGNSNFNNTQVYAQIQYPNSAEKSSSIFLVSKSFQYAIERDANEWKD